MADGSIVDTSESNPKSETKPEIKRETSATLNPQNNTSDTPLSIYSLENSKPYTANYYELGEHWAEFEEITQIESYIKDLVMNGEIEDSIKAVQTKLKQIEKMVNSDPTERKVIKLGKIAAYVKFLNESKTIERNANKYGKHY